jgi:DNA (cytosine-5)-methyltransferase 1
MGENFRIADLYCVAGGAGYGYLLGGLDVVGVDNKPQKRYPMKFILGDAIEYILNNYKDYDAIHASPPCQEYSTSTIQWKLEGKKYPDMVGETRIALQSTGLPFIIENVPNSPLIDPIILNGSVFGLLVHRKRLFECNFFVEQPKIPLTKSPIKMGRRVKEGDIIQPVGHFIGVEYAKKQMEIDWMIGQELSQAIPPAYTKYISPFLIAEIKRRKNGNSN